MLHCWGESPARRRRVCECALHGGGWALCLIGGWKLPRMTQGRCWTGSAGGGRWRISAVPRWAYPLLRLSPGARLVMPALGTLSAARWWRGELRDRDANLLVSGPETARIAPASLSFLSLSLSLFLSPSFFNHIQKHNKQKKSVSVCFEFCASLYFDGVLIVFRSSSLC